MKETTILRDAPPAALTDGANALMMVESSSPKREFRNYIGDYWEKASENLSQMAANAVGEIPPITPYF